MRRSEKIVGIDLEVAGGAARVIEQGDLFEKGGVNVSVVFGELPELVAKSMKVEGGEFFATGLSLVIHPRSPRIPTIHANFRYFEMTSKIGGSAVGSTSPHM